MPSPKPKHEYVKVDTDGAYVYRGDYRERKPSRIMGDNDGPLASSVEKEYRHPDQKIGRSSSKDSREKVRSSRKARTSRSSSSGGRIWKKRTGRSSSSQRKRTTSAVKKERTHKEQSKSKEEYSEQNNTDNGESTTPPCDSLSLEKIEVEAPRTPTNHVPDASDTSVVAKDRSTKADSPDSLEFLPTLTDATALVTCAGVQCTAPEQYVSDANSYPVVSDGGVVQTVTERKEEESNPEIEVQRIAEKNMNESNPGKKKEGRKWFRNPFKKKIHQTQEQEKEKDKISIVNSTAAPKEKTRGRGDHNTDPVPDERNTEKHPMASVEVPVISTVSNEEREEEGGGRVEGDGDGGGEQATLKKSEVDSTLEAIEYGATIFYTKVDEAFDLVKAYTNEWRSNL